MNKILNPSPQVRELVYDVEDTITDWLTQEAATSDGNILTRCFTPKFIILAQQVKALRERVGPQTTKVMAFKEGSTTDHEVIHPEEKEEVTYALLHIF